MQKENEISRRTFIASATKGAVLLSAAGMVNSCSLFSGEKSVIPRRKLGKTGLEVSILGFGGGSQFLKNKDGEWEKHLETALKSGINLFDTAPDYTAKTFSGAGRMGSEDRYGAVLPPYRSKIHLITKLDLVDGKRDPGGARKSLEGSLKRLKTDYIDILLIHAVNDQDSIAEIEKGVYKKMLEMKEEGLVKFIGFSSMDSAGRSRDLLENLDFDVAMLAINATRYRNYVSVALPVAREKRVGVIAIKTVRDLVGKDATAKELLEYVWTRDHVTTAMVGHYGLDTLKANIALAEAFGKSDSVNLDVAELESRMSAYAGPHALCWARPGYRDGGIIV